MKERKKLRGRTVPEEEKWTDENLEEEEKLMQDEEIENIDDDDPEPEEEPSNEDIDSVIFGLNELDKLTEHTSENAFKLKERLLFLKNGRKMSNEEICEWMGWTRAGQPNSKNIDLFCGNEHKRKWDKVLPKIFFQKIIRKLVRNNLWYSKEFQQAIIDRPHHMYHSLVAWLGVGERTEEEMRDDMEGNYRVYRHSMYQNDKVVVGRCQIEYLEKPDFALQVTETYGLQAEPTTKPISFRGLGETYTGYICRKNQHYYIFTRDKPGDRFNHTSLPNLRRGNTKKVVMLYGVTLGIFDGRVYTSPIMYERVDNPRHDWKKGIGVFPHEKIPATVMQFLNQNKPESHYKII